MADISPQMKRIRELERLLIDSFWVIEGYNKDHEMLERIDVTLFGEDGCGQLEIERMPDVSTYPRVALAD